MTQTDDRLVDAAPDKPPMNSGQHVLSAVREVMREVVGIAKAGEMKQQGKTQYHFQRYDDMAAAVGKAFRDHGIATQTVLVDKPTVHHWEKPTQSGKTLWTNVQVSMRFVLTSLVDGSTFTVESVGEGFDSSDKATNKAMTGAYKNALKIAFTLSTGEEDPDETRPEVVTRNAPQQPPQQPDAVVDPREHAVWDAVENLARRPVEQNAEPSRQEDLAKVQGYVQRCVTTGDLAKVASWALGKGMLANPAPGDNVPVAARILAVRGTLRVGPPSGA